MTTSKIIEPTPERATHGATIARVERQIIDAAGAIGRPYRVVDTLAAMERHGTITAGMRRAGEDFRARFAVAQLDPLRAADMERTGGGQASDGPGLRIEAARRWIWDKIQTVGGISSPAGSCLWHVLGWQRSLKEWAIEQGWAGRRISQEAASGILVAALGMLAMEFQSTPPRKGRQ
jgi:hypothetical protein